MLFRIFLLKIIYTDYDYDLARIGNGIFKISFPIDGRFIDLHHNIYLF